MQRCRAALFMSGFERSWQNRAVFPNDRRGRFNLDEAAAELGLDEEYVASLYKPMHYTYDMTGEHYPSEQGRTSRPGSVTSSRNRMFPLYRRDNGLDRQLRKLDWRRVTTE